jgi:hypothetical protein
MFKKPLYVAAALITFAFTLPAQADDFNRDSRDKRQERKIAEKGKDAQRHEYHERDNARDQDRQQYRHQYRHDHHDAYHEEARRHQVEFRGNRRYYYDDYRYHQHHAYNHEPRLLDHLVVSLILR